MTAAPDMRSLPFLPPAESGAELDQIERRMARARRVRDVAQTVDPGAFRAPPPGRSVVGIGTGVAPGRAPFPDGRRRRDRGRPLPPAGGARCQRHCLRRAHPQHGDGAAMITECRAKADVDAAPSHGAPRAHASCVGSEHAESVSRLPVGRTTGSGALRRPGQLMRGGAEAARQKRCPRCAMNLSEGEFGPNASRRDGLQSVCKACRRSYLAERYARSPSARAPIRRWNEKARREAREIIDRHLRCHPCVDCGEPDPVVLEFDHRPGTKKCFNLADAVRRRRCASSILAEIAKCDVRCANCHRRVTRARSPSAPATSSRRMPLGSDREATQPVRGGTVTRRGPASSVPISPAMARRAPVYPHAITG